MRENEFEKNVQQRMDDFRLRPSDAVWGKVAGELHRKKKRRAVFLIFLLAGFGLLGYSGFYFLNHPKQNIVEENSTLTAPQSSKSGKGPMTVPPATQSRKATGTQLFSSEQTINKDKDAESILPEKQLPTVTDIETRREAIARQKVVKQQNASPEISDRATVKKRTTRQPFKSTPANKIHDKYALKKTDRDQQHEINIPDETEAERIAGMGGKSEEKSNPVTDPLQEQKEDSSVSKAVALKDIVDSSALAIEVEKPVTRKSPKIRWGVDFSAGSTDSRKSALPFSNGQKILDAYNNVPQGGFPGSAGYFPIQPPSPVDAGVGFKVGPVGLLQISTRSRVSFGLQYAFMSSRMKTGTYTATNVVVNNAITQSLRLSAVYQGIYREDFTNRYHFIQAPVIYHWQLNKGKKLPIDWNIGASAGYLVATNGLLYDSTAGGIYYHDKDAYNRFQFNVHTGFSFRFGNNRKIQWSVGPELSMAMNKLVDDPYSKKQYLMYGGVTGRLIFSKKK